MVTKPRGKKARYPLCPVCKVRTKVWISGVSFQCPKCGRFVVKGTLGYDEGIRMRVEADQVAEEACGFHCSTDSTICGKFETEECHHPIKSRRVLRRAGWNG